MNKFVRDHMGYRFVVRDARIPSKLSSGDNTALVLEIENTGFGKLLFPSRAEVIVKNESGEGFAVASGALEAIPGGAKKRIAFKFKAPDVEKSGKYSVYLRVSAPFKDEIAGEIPRRPIRFANSAMWDDLLKANALGVIELTATAAGRKRRAEYQKGVEERAKARAEAEAAAKAEKAAVSPSDKGTFFTDTDPLVIDMKGKSREVKKWHQNR
jgi:hypothetical protein